MELIGFKKEKPVEQKKAISCYHNFQKHLVLTLRNIVKLSSFEHSPESFELEQKLWRTFLKGKKTNKTLIGLTLVSMDFAGKSELEKKKLVKRYGFEHLLKNYSELEIKEAQRNLREAVLKELMGLNILENRRFKDKEGFELYFKNFINELKNGNMEKRVALKKSSENSDDGGMSEEELNPYLSTTERF